MKPQMKIFTTFDQLHSATEGDILNYMLERETKNGNKCCFFCRYVEFLKLLLKCPWGIPFWNIRGKKISFSPKYFFVLNSLFRWLLKHLSPLYIQCYCNWTFQWSSKWKKEHLNQLWMNWNEINYIPFIFSLLNVSLSPFISATTTSECWESSVNINDNTESPSSNRGETN